MALDPTKKHCVCPKCRTLYPWNNTHGHCSRCHETFVGLSAFEKHWITRDDRRMCIGPELEDGEGLWWTDEDYFWHYGAKMTEEERERRFGGDSDTG